MDFRCQNKINKTVKWLESQPVENDQKYVHFVDKRCAYLRKVCELFWHSIDKEINT